MFENVGTKKEAPTAIREGTHLRGKDPKGNSVDGEVRGKRDEEDGSTTITVVNQDGKAVDLNDGSRH
ncbi:hypothetical protein COT65_00685 [Candidatus Shapirobacteria bacterium CG09_land_8_20_14_0_10_47_13]|uniref:Hypervirulence associated protein TUDOR domain-containing protein n=1 Tax=Candidatus Shapirobacteria bacterium CG09_land_8_20_14_0_10_47_13 TaxID=1974481 RepID=A0A2H0WN74_9BACT|nr:MAG: hypothetical protein COT65_00685 [Candidatus Shapirobacteria bacterium CG09_land_8_20_14_0_10_47_13]